MYREEGEVRKWENGYLKVEEKEERERLTGSEILLYSERCIVQKLLVG